MSLRLDQIICLTEDYMNIGYDLPTSSDLAIKDFEVEANKEMLLKIATTIHEETIKTE